MLDLIIIGGSAAGASAGIYAARRGLNFKIIAKDFGGEVATSGEIGNWPGINQTDGITLANQFKEHLKFYNVTPEEGVDVESISKQDNGTFCIRTKIDPRSDLEEGHQGPTLDCDYVAKSVIIATGVHPKELNIPGEKEFRNKGVSYCTVCDGPLFKDKKVAIIGGGNSALESGLMMSDIAQSVYVINKNAVFVGDNILLEKLKEKKNVNIIYEAMTKEITGDGFVKSFKYLDKSGNIEELPVDGIFVHIGMMPNSQIAPAEVAKNKFGEIIVNKNCETNIPGIYAAGDVTDVPFKQIIIAAGQGSVAALSAVQYINKN